MTRGRRLDLAFGKAARNLDPTDRRFAQEIAYGTIRLRGRLDHRLNQLLDRGIGSLDPGVLDALRLGAYQLLEADGVPAYAAVSQTVELVRAAGGARVGGLANAVLRRLGREGAGPEHFPRFETDPTGWLTTWGSHPKWLIDRWLARWTPAEVRALVDFDNAVPEIFFRPLGGEAAVAPALADLEAIGVEADPVEGGAGTLKLPAGVDPSEVLERTPGVIQDPGAAWVSRSVDPPPGGLRADLCAAPGGKAVDLALGAGYLLAADASAPRLALVRENFERIASLSEQGDAADGLSRVGFVQARAEHPPIGEGRARVLLLDVPCTGTGTLRRHPDARWRLDPEAIGTLAEVQRKILRGAAPIVEKGGLLVYSTCTLEPEENGEQIDRFLEAHPDFRLEPSASVPGRMKDGAGRLVVHPGRHGFDGSFAARLRRV